MKRPFHGHKTTHLALPQQKQIPTHKGRCIRETLLACYRLFYLEILNILKKSQMKTYAKMVYPFITSTTPKDLVELCVKFKFQASNWGIITE